MQPISKPMTTNNGVFRSPFVLFGASVTSPALLDSDKLLPSVYTVLLFVIDGSNVFVKLLAGSLVTVAVIAVAVTADDVVVTAVAILVAGDDCRVVFALVDADAVVAIDDDVVALQTSSLTIVNSLMIVSMHFVTKYSSGAVTAPPLVDGWPSHFLPANG